VPPPKLCPCPKINNFAQVPQSQDLLWLWYMFNFARLSLGLVARSFRSRRRLLLENLALRQQLAVLKRSQARPKLSPFDKLFWLLACRFWTDWRRFVLVVTSETVVRWHHAGFRLYWSLISKARKQIGRKKLSMEVREVIVRWWRRTQSGALLAFTASFSCWALVYPREPSPAE